MTLEGVRLAAVVSLCISTWLFSSGALGQPPSTSPQRPRTNSQARDEVLKRRSAQTRAAKEAYEKLLAEYQTGKLSGAVHLELLHTWSMRIFQSGIDGPVLSMGPLEGARSRWLEHEKRMHALETIVATLSSQGKATDAEVAAAGYYAMENLLPALESLGRVLDERDLPIKLPSAAEAKPVASARTIVIQVEASGKFQVEGKPVDEKGLQTILADAGPPNRVRIVIRAHQDTPFNEVTRVMNHCQRAKIENFTFQLDQ